MTKVCISFAGSSGLSGFPDFPPAAAQQLQAEFPEAKVVLARTPEQRRAELTDTDVLFTVRFSPADFTSAKQLKWLHLSSAGATHVLFPEMIESNIIVTNSRGLYGIPIAEHVIGVMIILARKLHEAYRFQLEGKWPRKEMFDRYPSFSELHGRTAGVIGLGDIGLAVAERAKALGMRVIATKRHVGAPPACVDELLGPEGLPHLLQMSDFVVVAAPLTSETKGLIGERELRLMKPTAYIFNVGRGAIIQEVGAPPGVEGGLDRGRWSRCDRGRASASRQRTVAASQRISHSPLLGVAFQLLGTLGGALQAQLGQVSARRTAR